jgi:hypothetical protein
MSWPLSLHIGGTVPKDLGDPLPQAWQVAWDGHALLHQPFHFFQSNTFWPLNDSLAFSDALIGYTPAGLLGHGWKAAVARYDVLFLFAYALAFAGSYLLAFEAGLGRPAAVIAGALRSLGVRTVILHPAYAAGTAWSTWAGRSVRGLGAGGTARASSSTP